MHFEINDPVLSGKQCGYCNQPTEYVDSSVIFKVSYGMVYFCQPCSAWVGVHKGTDISLGRVAKGPLRRLKKEAHEFFDHMWKRKMSKGMSKGEARSKAYQWLSIQMQTDPEVTHIGMFDEKQCERVIELCKPFYKT